MTRKQVDSPTHDELVIDWLLAVMTTGRSSLTRPMHWSKHDRAFHEAVYVMQDLIEQEAKRRGVRAGDRTP